MQPDLLHCLRIELAQNLIEAVIRLQNCPLGAHDARYHSRRARGRETPAGPTGLGSVQALPATKTRSCIGLGQADGRACWASTRRSVLLVGRGRTPVYSEGVRDILGTAQPAGRPVDTT